MKKLFLFSVAALAFCACSSDEVVSENSAANQQPKEISFAPLTKPNTRAAVDGTTFPTTLDMMVTAYQVEATGGSAAVYFDATPFKYHYAGGTSGAGTYWGGDPAKYWPLTPAYINFLAIANANADNATGVTWGTNKADQVTIVMSDNSSDQRDLMYARGNGAVTQSGNTLDFPTKVDMKFKHAQAWMDFYVKANTTVETAITVNSITLKGAKYAGTYTITHTNYDAKASQSVAGVWSNPGAAKDVEVPGWTPATNLTTSLVQVGKGLLVVPDDDATTNDWDSFVINYTYDGKTYDYTYNAPTAPGATVAQATHYVFNITFTLHEIFVQATVLDWTDATATNVPVG